MESNIKVELTTSEFLLVQKALSILSDRYYAQGKDELYREAIRVREEKFLLEKATKKQPNP